MELGLLKKLRDCLCERGFSYILFQRSLHYVFLPVKSANPSCINSSLWNRTNHHAEKSVGLIDAPPDNFSITPESLHSSQTPISVNTNNKFK